MARVATFHICVIAENTDGGVICAELVLRDTSGRVELSSTMSTSAFKIRIGHGVLFVGIVPCSGWLTVVPGESCDSCSERGTLCAGYV